MGNNLTPVVLIADLLGISLRSADTLLSSRSPSVSLRAFARRLADGEVNHPLVNRVARSRLKAMFDLQVLMSEECLNFAGSAFNWKELQDYLIEMLDGRVRETFVGLFFNGRNELIARETLFIGSTRSAFVDPGVVLTRALSHQAVSVVVAHNHPSGSIVPSQADIEMTCKLARCLKLVDIALTDHIIVAAGRCESLRNLGFV